MTNTLIFDVAGPADHDQIFALNYQTFVEEIPQHPPHPSKRLIDRFHDQNTYIIARCGDEIVGMVAVRAERPFSLDGKVADLDRELPPHSGLCEVRLLCVQTGRRRGPVFAGLMDRLMQEGRERGYDLAVVSGTVRQRRLYRHMGFVPFGTEVGSPEARYQPMYMTMSAFQRDTGAAFTRRARLGALATTPGDGRLLSFLPGPVAIHPDVREAFEAPSISHRSAPFLDQVARVRRQLCQLTHAERAAILLGSGTLANDVIGGQIWQSGGAGVVVVDGEFGRRLEDHARRWSLSLDVFERPWGQPWDLKELDAFLSARPETRWLWLTLCETSTGVLRDLDALRLLCATHEIELYLDAVSAIGAVPVDLTGVRMASAVSGKALGSFAGLAVVLENSPRSQLFSSRPRGPLPRYLDLALYNAEAGVPFTQSSHLVAALDASLQRYASDQVFSKTARAGQWLRDQLGQLEIKALGESPGSNPAVTTIVLPAPASSRAMGDALKRRGIQLSYESDYLLRRNWLQVCLMGDFQQSQLTRLIQDLAGLVSLDKKTPATRHRLAAAVSGRTRQ